MGKLSFIIVERASRGERSAPNRGTTPRGEARPRPAACAREARAPTDPPDRRREATRARTAQHTPPQRAAAERHTSEGTRG
jgi:hypothetical protein